MITFTTLPVKYSRTLLRSLSRNQRIRDSLSGKTSYRGKLLMRGVLIRVLLYSVITIP
jgi:hypothetical protein